MGKSGLSLGLFASVVTVGVAAAFSPADARRHDEAVPGEILVGFRTGSVPSEAQAKLGSSIAQILGHRAIRSIATLRMDDSIQKIVLDDPLQTRAAILQLRQSFGSAIKYAEPNFIYHADVLPASLPEDGEPNDADFNQQWDLKNTGQVDGPGHDDSQTGRVGSDINVVPLWKEGVTGSQKTLVAVIDSGIDFNHPDLTGNMYTNPGEIPGNYIDDDHNGIIDDVHGANFLNGAGTANSYDDFGHGTHCAGTIGAFGNDGRGLVGVNWNVALLPIKFLSAKGYGTTEGAVNAIKYATRMGARILSNSWGGDAFSQAMKDAIEEANAAGALFIAAAGNDSLNNDSHPHYPANYDVPNVVSVAATDNRDRLASFSNYGSRTVHVAAPGKNILSTLRGGQYGIYSGTSMATPHVSGIAALIWAPHPAWTAAEVKKRLIATSTLIPALRKKSLSRGRVNAYDAFHGIVR